MLMEVWAEENCVSRCFARKLFSEGKSVVSAPNEHRLVICGNTEKDRAGSALPNKILSVLFGSSAVRLFGSANSGIIAPGSARAMASGHKSLVPANLRLIAQLDPVNKFFFSTFGRGVTSKEAFS